MNNYTKLFKSLITSTIWQEDNATRVLWITLLAMSDADGMVEGSIPGLAHLAGITIEECEMSLKKLSAPDKYSRTPDNEGRRIKSIDGGWMILNRAKYRDKDSPRTEYMREYMRERRKQPVNTCKPNSKPCKLTVNTERDIDIERDIVKEKERVKTKKKNPPTPPEFPKNLDTPEFRQAWSDWEQHHREIKKKLTPLAVKRQLKILESYGLPDAIAMIEQSISNGWQGLFELKNNYGKSNTGKPLEKLPLNNNLFCGK